MKHVVLALVLLLSSAAAALAAEPAPAAAIDIDQVKRMMIGTWQRNDDTRFTRELDADGVVVDRYEGDESATIAGTWSLVRGNTVPGLAKNPKIPPDAIFLQLSQNGDAILLGVAGLDPQSLQLVNILNGNRIVFVRLK